MTEMLKTRLQDPWVRAILVVTAAASTAAVVLVGWATQPDRFSRGYAPEQPIPFSHRLHAGELSVPCLYCHSGARRSRLAGMPAVETCMNCHRVTKTESPPIRRLREIFETDGTLAWKRVHSLPDHVYFDHRPHVGAGVACQTCHGPVESMDVLRQEMSMRMSNCLGCHRSPQEALPPGSPIRRGPQECTACHR